MEGAFWWKEHFSGWGVLVEGALAGLGVVSKYKSRLWKYKSRLSKYKSILSKYKSILSNYTKYTFKVHKYTII